MDNLVILREARAHGVGYFKFSTDEEKRQEEQEMLRRVREETEVRQKETQGLRERREAQKQTRLIAARQRQRARLGLPTIDPQEILKEMIVKDEKPEEKEEPVRNEPEDLEESLKRAAHVRPWDVGKDGVKEPVMSQEEWVEKKRDERNTEFAPVYIEDTEPRFDPSVPPPQIKKRKIFNVRQSTIASKEERSEEPLEEGRSGGAEIPPPLEWSYQNPAGGSRSRRGAERPQPRSVAETEAAIEAGLRYLKEQAAKEQEAKKRAATLQ